MSYSLEEKYKRKRCVTPWKKLCIHSAQHVPVVNRAVFNKIVLFRTHILRQKTNGCSYMRTCGCQLPWGEQVDFREKHNKGDPIRQTRWLNRDWAEEATLGREKEKRRANKMQQQRQKHQFPDRHNHNLRASKSVDGRFWIVKSSSIDGFVVYKIVSVSVGLIDDPAADGPTEGQGQDPSLYWITYKRLI